jgi:citrate/tricarballylate utilization protein
MAADALQHGAHVMTVCNACRYCEQFCPVFPAMEQRLVFEKADLTYLANLCHNCGECLYACQYAPPHEFGIDVPRTLATIRHVSYDDYAWPRWLASAVRQNGATSAITLAGLFAAVMIGATMVVSPGVLAESHDAHFYRVVPHGVMVALFGGIGLAVAAALLVACARCWRELGYPTMPPGATSLALRDAMTLRHLHSSGIDCVAGEEQRSPWRRWFHHGTLYGFLLCLASTMVAAGYHTWGFEAPYGYASLPVVLGTIGGGGLLIGPAGLWVLRRRRDPALADQDRAGQDDAFIALLFITSLTGLLLLLLRGSALMGALLLVHLGAVLALFVTLPYGKFVHAFYRTLALLKYHAESAGRAK